jgi:hypothetical protein
MDPRGIRNCGGVTIAAVEIILSCKLTSTVEDMLNLITRIFHILVKLRQLGAGFGIETKVEMATALDNLVQRARDNGTSSKGADTLNQLVRELKDVWAIKLGPG